jgi:hypothetical protein
MKPKKIQKPTEGRLDPMVVSIIQELLKDLEKRRLLLGKKIPLSSLEVPIKFRIK